MERLLLFGLPDMEKVESIAMKLRIRIALVPREQYTACIGVLAGYKTAAAATVPALDALPPEGMLVMCGLKNSRLDRLLLELNRAGVSIPYKAVLTPTNAGWNALQLAYELIQEHQKLSGRGES